MSTEASEHTESQHEQAGKAPFPSVEYFLNTFSLEMGILRFNKCVEAVKCKYCVNVNHA